MKQVIPFLYAEADTQIDFPKVEGCIFRGSFCSLLFFLVLSSLEARGFWAGRQSMFLTILFSPAPLSYSFMLTHLRQYSQVITHSHSYLVGFRLRVGMGSRWRLRIERKEWRNWLLTSSTTMHTLDNMKDQWDTGLTMKYFDHQARNLETFIH